jgi:hypothetical protein
MRVEGIAMTEVVEPTELTNKSVTKAVRLLRALAAQTARKLEALRH